RADDLFEHRSVVDFFAQRQVFAAQPLFGLLSIFNIGSRRIPAYDPSLFIPLRIVLYETPAILPVLLSRAQFQLERTPAQKARATLNSHSVYVIRMEGPRKKAVSVNLFERQTGLVKRDPIHIERSPIRPQDGNSLGNGISDLSQLYFILPELFFNPLPVFDVGTGSTPVDDITMIVV